MRHLKAGRKLGRNATHRLALKRNLALALFRHERIITTVEKAKEVRPFVEKLITLAKKGTLHARRLVIARLGPTAKAEVHQPDKDNDPRSDTASDPDEAVQRHRAALRRPAGRLHAHHQAARTPPGRRRQDRVHRAAEGRRDETNQEGAPPPAPAPKVETPPHRRRLRLLPRRRRRPRHRQVRQPLRRRLRRRRHRRRPARNLLPFSSACR